VEGQLALGGEAGPRGDPAAGPPHALEGLLERQHEPAGPPGAQREEGQQRLQLRVLLAAEAAARVGCEDPHLVERPPQDRGEGALQQVGVLDGGVDVQPAGVGGHHDGAARLDREVRDHRERVGVLDDDRGARLLRLDVAPGVVRLLEHVGAREGVAGADRGVLDQVGVPGERGVQGVDAGQLAEVDDDGAGAGLRGVEGLGEDGGHRLAVVVHPAVGQHRPIGVRDAEPWHRRGQIGGRHHVDHPGDRPGGGGVDPQHVGAADRDRHQRHLQRPGEAQVGDEPLRPRRPVAAAVAEHRPADLPARVEVRRQAELVALFDGSFRGRGHCVPPRRAAVARTACTMRW
jgi:hypothetical protein